MRVFPAIFGALALCGALGAAACQGNAPEDPRAQSKQRFDSACAKCHGRDGRGGVPAAEGLAPPRNFVDASYQASRTDAQLREAIVKGKGSMPPFGKLFSEPELEGLVAHIRSFNPKH